MSNKSILKKTISAKAIKSNRNYNTNAEDPVFRFVTTADSQGNNHGINEKVVNTIMQRIMKLYPKPSFFVIAGDLVKGDASYPKTKKQLELFKKTLTRYFPADSFYVGMGNHEASAGIKGERAIREVFNEFDAHFMKGYHGSVYYFDHDCCRFFILNSNHPQNPGIIADDQLAWVKKHIKKSSKHNFFFLHQPAYPSGNICHLVNAYARNKLWKIIDSSNSPMVFCGHEHNYSRRHINQAYNEVINGKSFEFTKNIYQITVGGFGGRHCSSYVSKLNVDVAPIPQYHFLVVDIMKDGRIFCTAYDIDGSVIDIFKY